MKCMHSQCLPPPSKRAAAALPEYQTTYVDVMVNAYQVLCLLGRLGVSVPREEGGYEHVNEVRNADRK